MKKKIKYNNFSLITGGTSGIGASFAYHLSNLGYNLVIVSNNSKKLSNISKSIKKKFNTNLITIKSDLSHEKGYEKIIKTIQKKKININFLINCAGMGYYGDFIKTDIKYNLKILNININSIVALCNFFSSQMRFSKDKSYIINVGSLSSFCPSPEMTIYSCSKNFIEKFTECLRYELKNTNVNVSYIAPGQTDTNFLRKFGKKINKKKSMSANDVVRIAMNKIFNNKETIITGGFNYFRYLLFKFLPDKLILAYFYNKIKKRNIL